LNDKPLPAIEVKIIWTNIYQAILEKFQTEVQKKADNQGDLRADYLYIKNNLFRAPFAIRDDPMKASVRKAFEGIYKTLLSTIIKQNLKMEKGKKRQRDEQETIRVNRSKLYSAQLEDEDEDIQPQHTKAYLREQTKRETQRSLMKATRSANRTAYMMKKQRKEEPTTEEDKEDKEAEDLIKQVRNNEPWWNQMDTTE